jgi:hypothetical protein
MRKINREKFKLSKIKLVGGGGLALKFDLEEIIGSDSYISSEDIKSSKEPHPDLADAVQEMRGMVGQIFGLSSIKTVTDSPKFGVDKVQGKFVQSWVDEMISRINITGISISGAEDKRGIVITATYLVDNRQRVAWNTPRVMLNGESRGFEERLKELVEIIEEEAFLFLYESKVANPEMFDYNEEPKSVDEPNNVETES